MIPVKIISKVDIPSIQEDVIASLIKAEILRSNPELTIDSINFERKLNPQRIEANVEAHLSKSVATETVTVEEVNDALSAKAIESPLEDTPEEAVEKEPEPEVAEVKEEELEKPRRKKVFS